MVRAPSSVPSDPSLYSFFSLLRLPPPLGLYVKDPRFPRIEGTPSLSYGFHPSFRPFPHHKLPSPSRSLSFSSPLSIFILSVVFSLWTSSLTPSLSGTALIHGRLPFLFFPPRGIVTMLCLFEYSPPAFLFTYRSRLSPPYLERNFHTDFPQVERSVSWILFPFLPYSPPFFLSPLVVR